MKKSRFIVLPLIFSMMLPGNLVEAKGTKKPNLNKTKLVLKVGGSKQLSVKNKRKWKIKKMTFSSSKTKIAKVTKKGKVKALRKGKATITCKVVLKNGKKYRLKCKVTVQNKKKKSGKTAVSKNPSPSQAAVPSVTGNSQTTVAPTETGKPSGSGEPAETGRPQGSGEPSETKAPVSPVTTATPKTTAVAVSRFTLPPAATFTPSPVNVSKVSHLSKNGINTLDTGVMRDDMDAYDVVWDMGLATNLGNTMESCGDWINKSSVTNYETAWGAPVTTQEMLTAMKAAGFSSIRIPVGWSNMMADDGSYTINEEYFNRVETIMNYALNEDMYVIINIHYDGGWWARFGSKDETERKEAMKKYENMWLQIANRFQEYSDYVIFESANEELGTRLNSKDDYAGSGYFTSDDELYQLTNIINQTFVNIVRSTGGNNARRCLLIAGFNTDIQRTCDSRYQMPDDNIDSRLMISIHYYSPATYCLVESPDNSWGYSDSWGSDAEIAELKSTLGNMRIHFVNKGYPVIIGEYGVSDSKIDGNMVRKEGRDLFFKTVCEYATQNNMCPVLWDCNQIFNRRTCSMTNETEKNNYLSLSQSVKATPVVKPHIVKGRDIWSGKLAYGGWVPRNSVQDDACTFSVQSVGGCYEISGIDWSKYEHPVFKVKYSGNGSGDTLQCRLYRIAKEEQYWTSIYEDERGFIAGEGLKKETEAIIDLSAGELTGTQKVFIMFAGVENFEADFSITVSEGE